MKSSRVPLLEIADLRFRWPRATSDVLDLPRLVLEPSQRVLVHGDSGCGKSTLLSLAAGVLVPQQGRAALLGKPWSELGAAARDQRRVDHVGYIFQQFNLLPYLSVLDNVLLPCRFSPLRAKRALLAHGSARDAATSLLEGLGIDAPLWTRDAAALSVGQQQRVAAARALIGQPELVIADEPTSALDERLRDTFMTLLVERCERFGSALLFVSHDTRLARHFAQSVDLAMANRAALAPAKAA